MKKLLSIIALATLCGCTNEIQKYDISRSDSFCATNGGIHSISKIGNAVTTTCVNGTVGRVDMGRR